MTNFSDLLAQAKEMQEKMKNAQESLKKNRSGRCVWRKFN